METLPTSKFTAYSENKGEKIAFCLNKKGDNENLIDEAPNICCYTRIITCYDQVYRTQK